MSEDLQDGENDSKWNSSVQVALWDLNLSKILLSNMK